MKASTVLARVGTHYAPHLSDARRALRQKAIDAAFASPRIWMEKLEPRRLMDATAATVTLDPAFGQAGLANPLPPNRTELHSSYTHLTAAGKGKFYAITNGDWTYPRGYVAFELIRVNADGSLDPTFTPPQIERQTLGFLGWGGGAPKQLIDDSLLVNSVLVQPDGKVIVVARDVPYQSPDPFLVMRFNTDGSPDQGFGTAGVNELPVNPMTAGLPTAWLTPAGKIDVMNVGHFTSGDSAQVAIRQINADGTMDDSFGTAGQVTLDVPTDMRNFVDQAPERNAVWSADLAGVVPLPEGGSVAYLDTHAWSDGADYQSNTEHAEVIQLRLDANGGMVATKVLEATTVELTPANQNIDPLTVSVQPNGKALVSDPAAHSLHRFNTYGTPDTTFNADLKQLLPPGFADSSETFLPQADGTILVSITDGKHFYSGLKRLRGDGSLDTTFAGGQPIFGFEQNQSVTEAITLGDGSILTNISSSFQVFWFSPEKGTSPSLAKLLPGGGAPNTFDAQAAEAGAQTAYDLAHPPYVPVTTDPVPPSDGVIPIDITTGDPSIVPTLDGFTTDGSSASDISADPLAGAGLTDATVNSTSGTTGINLFTLNAGSSVFNPDGTKKVFDAGF